MKLKNKLFNKYEVNFPYERDVVLLVGANGSGKTKTLELLSSELEERGEHVLYFKGERYFEHSLSDVLEFLYEESKKVDNTLEMLGIDYREIDYKDLEENRYQFIRSGFYQLLNFFTAIYKNRDKEVIVIIDEIERSLGFNLQDDIINAFQSFNNVKKIFASTHSPCMERRRSDGYFYDVTSCVQI